jgi:transcriptional regulator with XRE-family HTH domain
VVVVSSRTDIREFLATRRAKLTPQQAGLRHYGHNRRVPGLRREEVALLAGVSVDYYVRLEKGNLTGVSDGVLDAVARALQLDEAERTHLFDLARSANRATRSPRRRASQQIRPGVQRTLDSMHGTPAFVLNGRLDILTANALGLALFSPIYATRRGHPTTPGSSSSTRMQPSSSATGTRSPKTPLPCCAPKPQAIPTTGSCRT